MSAVTARPRDLSTGYVIFGPGSGAARFKNLEEDKIEVSEKISGAPKIVKSVEKLTDTRDSPKVGKRSFGGHEKVT